MRSPLLLRSYGARKLSPRNLRPIQPMGRIRAAADETNRIDKAPALANRVSPRSVGRGSCPTFRWEYPLCGRANPIQPLVLCSRDCSPPESFRSRIAGHKPGLCDSKAAEIRLILG